MLAYFDSSIILSILLDAKKQQEALAYWQNASLRLSSSLLKLETLMALRRFYEYHKNKLDTVWLVKKSRSMEEYFKEVNYRNVDEKIERSIYFKKELAGCRVMDAVHIATALDFRELSGDEDIFLYTFDPLLHGLAERYKFKTNKLPYKVPAAFSKSL